MYRQFTCIDRWDDNTEYFDRFIKLINQKRYYDVVNDMKYYPESNIDQEYSLDEIINEKANNSGESLMYTDDTFALTASLSTITLFKKWEN